jgi:hypothetical protein
LKVQAFQERIYEVREQPSHHISLKATDKNRSTINFNHDSLLAGGGQFYEARMERWLQPSSAVSEAMNRMNHSFIKQKSEETLSYIYKAWHIYNAVKFLHAVHIDGVRLCANCSSSG